MSYVILPASKGVSLLQHFCCRTLLLLQRERGGCRTLRCYWQGSASWRGTCNLPLPGLSVVPQSPGLAVPSLCYCAGLSRGCT